MLHQLNNEKYALVNIIFKILKKIVMINGALYEKKMFGALDRMHKQIFLYI